MKSHLHKFAVARAALLAGACLALPLLHCGTAPGDAVSEASVSGEAADAQGATIEPVLAPGKCLDVAWASQDDGAEIQLWDCNGGAQEAWAYAGGMLSVYGNKCLDVKDGIDRNGTRLQIWDCTPGNANQQWVRRGNTWEWAGHGKCLDVPGGITQAGTRLQIWDCLNNANQQWSGGGVTSSPPPPAPLPPAPPPPPASPWKLVWSDEFDGASVDQGKWNYEVNCEGGGNHELQCYTASAANAFVTGGHLALRVLKQDLNGKPYTSARLNSAGKGDWTYGRFESRARVPCGQGFWPAVWMLPTDWVYGSWPTSGELDIMEILGGNARQLFGTAHFGPAWPNNKHLGGTVTLGSGSFCDDYHVFAIERAADHVTWSVDGSDYFTLRSTDASWSPAPHWPFDQRFHFVLNVAMGGDWPGAPDPGIQAGEMDVDYVRAFVKN